MASRGSQGTPPTNRESFLIRKKKEIVDKSMDFLQQTLNRCLDNSVSAPPQGEPPRGAKRARDDGHGEDCGGGGRGHRTDAKGKVSGDGVETRTKKKRLSPREAPTGGKKFACPFSKHDPAKYGNVKTCLGPGWDDVHRVKEHVYRRHSLKNFCPRCFEHFDKPDALKKHQRADKPCALRDRSPDAITDEQEKLLRARAKSHCDEKVKWEDMYRTIFPGEKVPSPYYDASTASGTTNKTDSNISVEPTTSRWESMDECKDFLRAEIPRLVRPAIERYVDTLLAEVQDKVNQKAVEIIRDVEARVLRTFHFREEQASSVLLSTSAAGGTTTATLLAAGPGESSPPPSPGVGPEVSSTLTEMFETLHQDSIGSELCRNLDFANLENLLAGQQGSWCDGFSVDSAYFTSSLAGGHDLYGLGGAGYPLRY